MGLSIWQLKRQLAYLAGKAAWAVTPQGLVYSGGSIVSEDLEGNFRLGSASIDGPKAFGGADNAAGIAPFCRVRLLSSEWDPRASAPRIEKVSLQMWSTAGGGAVPGTPSQTGFDSHGINMVTGVLRDPTNPLGLSQGRDLDEIIARFAKLHGFFVDSVDGFQGRCRVTGSMVPVNGSMVLKRALSVEALNPLDENYYPSVLRPAATNSGSDVILTWSGGSFPNRFDALAIMVRRGALAGDAAPLTPGGVSNGHLISDVMPDATGCTDTNPGSGVWNYAIFTLFAESPMGWPMITVQGLALTGYTITVHTSGGNFTVPVVAGADLTSTAQTLADAINASSASPYAEATSNGAVVTVQPIGFSPWLAVSINAGVTSGQLDRTNGDNYARTVVSVSH